MSVEASQTSPAGAAKSRGETPTAPRRGGWRRFVLFTLGLLAVAVLTVVATLQTLPDDFVRGRIVAAVEEATGRELRIDGPARVAFRPNVVVSLGKVTLAGARGPEGPPLVKADEVEAEVPLLPLLRGRTDVARARLVKPAITISPEDAELLGGGGGGTLTIAGLSVVDGALNVMTAGPNPALRIDQLTAELKGISADGLQNGTGTFRWRGEPIRFDLKAVPEAGATRNGALRVDAKFDGSHGATAFAGSVDPAAAAASGKLDVRTPSLRKLLAWFDVKPGASALAGPASAEGAVKVSASGLELTDAAFKVPGGEGKLTATLAIAGNRPSLAGRIDWNELEVDTLIGSAPPPAAGLEARVKVVDPVPQIDSGWGGLGALLAGIERKGVAAAALETREAAGVPAKPSGWSAKPIDLAALQKVDVDLAQTAGKIRFHGLVVEKVKSTLKLVDGRLALAVDELAAGKGKAAGKLSVDTRKEPPELALDAKTDNVPLETVVKELVGTRVVSGATRLDVSLKGRGKSQRDIVASLGGKAAMTIEKGEIIGYNLRRALIEWWRKWSYDPKQRTQFAKLGANLDVKDGVLTSEGDIALSGPDVDIVSRGAIRLSSRTIEQSLRMKLAPPPQHLPVPLKVSGSWTKPSIGWDLFSVMAEPRALAAPQALFASPEPPPAEIVAAIDRVLADQAKTEQMPPDVRNLLLSLRGK